MLLQLCLEEARRKGAMHVYVRMYVCMYVSMDVCRYACMHACMYSCTYSCMYAWITYVCIYAHMHVYMQWWTQGFILGGLQPHTSLYPYACMYACTYVHSVEISGMGAVAKTNVLVCVERNIPGDWNRNWIKMKCIISVSVQEKNER